MASREGKVLPPVSVAIYAPPDATDSLVDRICAETEAIWAPAGIEFEWQCIPTPDTRFTGQLLVRIDEIPWRLEEHPDALGWIHFTASGPEPSIHLSSRQVEDLILRTGLRDSPLVVHETLVGRALGRALSHELGHYFLRSKTHSSYGLMRAIRPSGEFFAINRSGFELTATERDTAFYQFDTTSWTDLRLPRSNGAWPD